MNKETSLLVTLALIVSIILTVAKVAIVAIGGAAAIVGLLFLSRFIVEQCYFNGKRFNALKDKVAENTKLCNELNAHIKYLEAKYLEQNFSSPSYGLSEYRDSSVGNYKRPLIDSIHNNTPKEYFCSLQVCRSAESQPFKYLCKYFNIAKTEVSLHLFEDMFNDFSAADEGKKILIREREELLKEHADSIPSVIRKFSKKKLFDNLGYTPIDLLDDYYPHFAFKYISSGARSSMTCDIILGLNNLESFINYLSEQIRESRTAKYQRSLMTNSLREQIKRRDHYTCQHCGVSINDEPNLLLEIDHIIPVSKGGLTTIDNLQTLCWKCNRHKGASL